MAWTLASKHAGPSQAATFLTVLPRMSVAISVAMGIFSINDDV